MSGGSLRKTYSHRAHPGEHHKGGIVVAGENGLEAKKFAERKTGDLVAGGLVR